MGHSESVSHLSPAGKPPCPLGEEDGHEEQGWCQKAIWPRPRNVTTSSSRGFLARPRSQPGHLSSLNPAEAQEGEASVFTGRMHWCQGSSPSPPALLLRPAHPPPAVVEHLNVFKHRILIHPERKVELSVVLTSAVPCGLSTDLGYTWEAVNDHFETWETQPHLPLGYQRHWHTHLQYGVKPNPLEKGKVVQLFPKSI